MAPKTLLMIFSFFYFFTISAGTYIFDSCKTLRNWKVKNSGGTKTKLDSTPNGITIKYDLSPGQYVSVSPKHLQLGIKSIKLELQPSQKTQVTYRIIDCNGRTYQAKPTILPKGKTAQLQFKDTGKFKVWGGSSNSLIPERPYKSISLIINKNKKLPPQGQILLKKFTGDLDKSDTSRVNTEQLNKNACAWKLNGHWSFSATTPFLLMECSPLANAPNAMLEITMPQLAKDYTKRFQLIASAGQQNIVFPIPLKQGINPRNKYKLKFNLITSNEKFSFSTTFKGKQAEQINLGEAIDTSKIQYSKLGVNTHFIYPRFKGKQMREILFKKLREGGYKWIRDGIRFERNKAGQPIKVRDSDIEFMKMARANNIQILLIIRMRATDTIEEFLKQVDIIVRDTKEYASAYELGNEPNNYGGWRKKYSGSWNGWDPKEPDGISEWVKKHVEYSNAAADKINKLYPSAKIIGLGSPSCTNFRALMLPVNKNITGVADHPYPWSMLPERIPYSWGFKKRDGLLVGDEEGTLAGLYNSYGNIFKKSGIKRYLWITEFGWSTMWLNKDNMKKAHFWPGYSEKSQAEYLLRRYMEGLAAPAVTRLFMYEFTDDGKTNPFDRQRNFGLVRHDNSNKLSYNVITRLNALMRNAELDTEAKATVTLLSNKWLKRNAYRTHDGVKFKEDNGVRVYPYVDSNRPEERLLGIWSMAPYSEASNNRVVGFKIKGWKEFSEPPVAINMLTGDTYDLPVRFQNCEIVVEEMSLKAPLLIKFFKKNTIDQLSID